MPDVIDFDDAMKRTEGEDRALLLGNGFSAQYFSYRNLLDKSGLAAGTPVRDLFDALATVDFEAVVRALEGAVLVERAYGNAAHAAEIEGGCPEGARGTGGGSQRDTPQAPGGSRFEIHEQRRLLVLLLHRVLAEL
ncbi:hypothetical protein X743_09605 [Mesorhizobium sp. LNHC252B00]|uniref:DUF4917 family protein n=1 Tax=Mesorhizobium sp. LNHC252B00 TaxID=1287252 RepID=UPI0003CEB195|nr:DUF4917 family protein [Mesorhizobium sp. LNHC252B00]ESY74086.1 hypothetical protein X743_09605 [Mesorhizobium sp. LNHC252B00]